jgi:beta-glucanase (GH16 family)
MTEGAHMAKIAVNEDWGEPTGDSKSDLSINNVEYIRVIFCFV